MELIKINGLHFYNMIINANNKLEEQKDYVNALNVFPVPDGDTGTNMSMTLRNAASDLKGMKYDSISEVSKKFAKGALMGARGNSGVILSQIFRGIAKGLENKDEVSAEEFAQSFVEGTKYAYKAVMRPTEGTILTIIRAAGEAAVKSSSKNITVLMKEICVASEIMLNKTPDMNPVLKKAKVVDSGGVGLLIIFKAMHEVLLNEGAEKEFKPLNMVESKESKVVSAAQNLGENHEIKFGYCTEFIVLTEKMDINLFKKEIEEEGDSMVVVGMEDVVKVHIHTNDPGRILSKAVKYGELSKIKIDNMREEHRHVLEGDYSLAGGIAGNEAVLESAEAINEEVKTFAFVSVSLGDGIKNIFKDLGVDCVIEGGQTMNPSTKDIVNAVNKTNAEIVFILPNNKNIIMAANQAIDICNKKVVVINTKTIPQGITALTAFNPSASLEENVQSMEEAIKTVRTGSVTYAVRDTEMDGKEIKEGNILGLLEGKINEVGTDIYEVCDKLIENLVDDDSALITIFYGADCNEKEALNFVSKIESKYTELDVQAYNGNQPLHYIIVSVE